MKHSGNILFFLLFCSFISNAQTISAKYASTIKKADAFYRTKNYKGSGLMYSQAFKSNGWKAYEKDRFNAACSWALAGIPDSSFYQLDYIAKNGFADIEQAKNEHDLNSLHRDKRWKSFLNDIQQNIEKKEARLNKPLINRLKQIHENDQNYRLMSDSIEKKFGRNSDEMISLWKIIQEKDSVNLFAVKEILDENGWLGADVIGEEGNSTLFLVIQHSDQKTQEKYLPLMREAVKNGNARGSELALLEDRVALAQGKKQIYGSQIMFDPKTEKHFIAPIEDEVNVDLRRNAVGLEPLEEYVKHWNIEYSSKKVKTANLSGKIENHSDMATAIEIHDSIAGPYNISKGSGLTRDFDMRIFNENSDFHQLKEENSVWFKFRFDHDTTLVFDIVPEDFQDDYDFALFRCADTDPDCFKKVKENQLKAERMCFSINEQKNGSTGLSLYSSKNAIGSGDGDGYVAAMNVKAGETYYLMTMYSNAYFTYFKKPFPKGFTIYFYNYWPKKPEHLKHSKQKPVILENILFETNGSVLQKNSFISLDKLAQEMKTKPGMKIEIRGHTDNSGDPLKNLELSEKRAKAVADYLISKSIDKARITSKGLGSTQQIASNETEEGKKKNRRVEFIILTK
jgi:outer membrane protein OmpA-like peptidoglycan-associated protein